MEVVLEIPDNIAQQLQTNGRTLRQRALEDLAVEAYRREELSLGQFAEMLNLSINDANGLLKERGIFDDLSLEEFDEQGKAMDRPRKKQTLSQALGLLATSAPPPSEEEVKQWLEEHRTEKYG